MREVLLAGIRQEGPIHADRLAKLTAGAFGLTRVVASRSAAILRAVPGSADAAGFYWAPEVDPRDWLLYRADSSGQRPIDQISDVEVANAMRDLCINAHGMAEEELHTETLRVFGLKRRTPKAVQVLDRAVAVGLAWGRIAKGADGLLLGR